MKPPNYPAASHIDASNQPLAHLKRALAAITFIALPVFATLGHGQPVRPETVATCLQNPWAVAFLPEGRFLVSERAGRMRVIQPDGKVGAPVAGLPQVAAGGQGELLDVLTDSGNGKLIRWLPG